MKLLHLDFIASPPTPQTRSHTKTTPYIATNLPYNVSEEICKTHKTQNKQKNNKLGKNKQQCNIKIKLKSY